MNLAMAMAMAGGMAISNNSYLPADGRNIIAKGKGKQAVYNGHKLYNGLVVTLAGKVPNSFKRFSFKAIGRPNEYLVCRQSKVIRATA